MTEKQQGRVLALNDAQIDALTSPAVKVELFVSSRLGPDVSRETKREHEVEHSVVARAAADLGDRQ
jgi:hypothetical protein